MLLTANIEKGIILTFERPTTEDDVKSLRSAAPGMGLIYNLGNTIILETRSDEERTTMEKRLKGAEDKGKPITVRRYDAKPPTSTGPIKFGAPSAGPIQFTPAPAAPPPTAPSTTTSAGDTASAMAVDPAPATQRAVYTPIVDGKVNRLEVRMDNVEKRCESMDSKLDRLVTATCWKHAPQLRKRP